MRATRTANQTQTGAPPPAALARPTSTAAPESPASSSAAATAKPVPYAVDRVVIECPMCLSHDCKQVPEKGRGPDWVRGECRACGKVFKVPTRELKA